jgi:hypothetical protein
MEGFSLSCYKTSNNFRHIAKENLESETGRNFYTQRKIDEETDFWSIEGWFAMRRATCER